MLSHHDAQLAYDGAIPPGAVDPAAPDLYRVAPHIRVGKVTLKPEAIRARMVRTMATLASAGAITEADLTRAGFTKSEIEAFAPDALRQVMVENPTFLSIDFAA